MDFALTDADRAVQEASRAFAEEHLAPKAREHDESGTFDRSRVPLMGAAGLLGGPIGEDVGGAGWTHLQWALALIELGRVDSSWRGFATVQTCLCGMLLDRYGTKGQREEWLPELTSGREVFAYALTEPEAGTDVASLQTVARPDCDGYLISGTKHWITNGGVADKILVFANADPDAGRAGITCFLVDGDSRGLERRPVEGVDLGHRASDHAVLEFDDVRVSSANVVGGYGKGYEVAMGGLLDGRLGVAAGAVGIQQAAVDASLSWARERRQFGRRIGDFQLVQSDLTEMYAALESSRLLTMKAAYERDQGIDNARSVSVAKWAACEAAVRSADQAVLLHGARGYSSAWPVERLLRDAKGLQIYEGTAHIQRIIVARDLLGKDEKRERR